MKTSKISLLISSIIIVITLIVAFSFTNHNDEVVPLSTIKNVISETTPLEIGTPAPLSNLKMKDISGLNLSLIDIKKDNGLLVIFSCNTCPFVLKWEDRYSFIEQICKRNNLGMVYINSNEAKRNGDDSFKAMQDHAKEKNYTANYLVDVNSVLANAFGAKTTPHVFLFDKNLNLAYKGAIDNNYENKNAATKNYLQFAIVNMTSGKTIDPSETNAKGCSIKRVKIN